MLRIDINVLFTIINLIILYVLVRKFLFKPMNKILDQRKALIEQQFAEAAEKEQAADALKAQYEDSLKQASAEGAQIISDAKAKAKAESNTILEHANAAAAELMETTKRSAQREKEKILKEVEPQVAYLAVAAAAKIVGEECSEEKNKALYDQFLIKAGDVSGTEE